MHRKRKTLPFLVEILIRDHDDFGRHSTNLFSGQIRQKRIVRADTRTIATLFGHTSAIELARTLGYDKAQKLHNDDDFIALQKTADKNGFDLAFEPLLQPVTPLPQGASLFLLRIKITVTSKVRTSESDVPVLTSFLL